MYTCSQNFSIAFSLPELCEPAEGDGQYSRHCCMKLAVVSVPISVLFLSVCVYIIVYYTYNYDNCVV